LGFGCVGCISTLLPNNFSADSYGQRAGIRVSLAGDPNWASTAAPMIAQIDKQDNASLRLLEWSTLKKDVEPTGTAEPHASLLDRRRRLFLLWA